MSEEFWSVAVDAPLPQSLTYRSPEALLGLLQRGHRVLIPLGRRKATGVLLSSQTSVAGQAPSKFLVKEILEIETEFQPLPEYFLKWLEWVSQYYQHPIGSVTGLAYPPLSRKVKARASQRAPVVPLMTPDSQPNHSLKLTDEQTAVLSSIQKHDGFNVHLLFGVTGSGKTEVYLQLLKETLEKGHLGLVLVPEISLTPQLIHRFAARFGDQIAVLHSQLTDRERTTQWWDIVEGRKKILIGARSALFCPIENLGLVIVDEEHESSFKQDEKLKYHGRDCAVMLGKFANCPVILGSATPSLESWKNTLDHRYQLHKMSQRVENRSLPTVEIIDMRIKNSANSEIPNWLSPQLFAAMNETLGKQQQVALFLNRRGVAPVVLCPSCGYTHECPNCDISLTLHGSTHLVCHYCDYHEDLKLQCPSCKKGELKPVGLGTELVQSEIERLFPNSIVARADRDEIQNRVELEDLIARMENGEIDILIGTQMIAKGLDFPKLNLVGLILADVGFNLPDFRATERSFQLITQVSGRAGRHIKKGEEPGKVLVQTYNPDHSSLQFTKTADFIGFAKHELADRAALNYPPHGRLISCRIQGLHHEKVQETARLLASRCRYLKGKNPVYAEIEVLGPAPAPLLKIRNQFRYQLLLKGLTSKTLNNFSFQVLGDESWIPAGTRILVDVDPIHLL